jgi:hypothetical protein
MLTSFYSIDRLKSPEKKTLKTSLQDQNIWSN